MAIPGKKNVTAATEGSLTLIGDKPILRGPSRMSQLRLGCLQDTADRLVEDSVELLVGLVNAESLG